MTLRWRLPHDRLDLGGPARTWRQAANSASGAGRGPAPWREQTSTEEEIRTSSATAPAVMDSPCRGRVYCSRSANP